jgi:hypothetical protein
MSKAFCILSLLMGVTACGGHEGSLPIMDGNGIVHGRGISKKNSLAKSIVAVEMEIEGKNALCTGTILDEQTILTAAHCVDNKPKKMVVIFGSKTKDANKKNTRGADHFVQNPQWQKTHEGEGDIALVHFTGGLPEGYETVQLAGRGFKLEAGQEVLEAGFGMSNVKKESGSGVLRQVKHLFWRLRWSGVCGKRRRDDSMGSRAFGDGTVQRHFDSYDGCSLRNLDQIRNKENGEVV